MAKAYALFLMAVMAGMMVAQPVSAGALTSVLEDRAGDAFIFPGARPGESFQDIVRAAVSLKDGRLIVTMEMAGVVPETPEARPGVTLLQWVWSLDTNLATFPVGFPGAPGYLNPVEYDIMILWDGTRFLAQIVDRTPLLTGGEAVITPLAFNVKGAELKTNVDATQVGDPSFFEWGAATINWATPLGTNSFLPVDIACCGTWPA